MKKGKYVNMYNTDNSILFDISKFTGFNGFFLELVLMKEHNPDEPIRRSFFYRCCKRNNISTHDVREVLKWDNTWPKKNLVATPSFYTAREWAERGGRLRLGNQPVGRVVYRFDLSVYDWFSHDGKRVGGWVYCNYQVDGGN